MTLAVGDFAELRDEWQGKPVTYYVEKGREADARRTMGETPAMIEFFSHTYGYPYAFPKVRAGLRRGLYLRRHGKYLNDAADGSLLAR